MMRVLWLLCLLMAFACPLPVRAMPTRAPEAGPTVDTPLPQPQWRTFAPPGGRFSVLLPATPVALAASRFQTYTCSVNGVRYVVQYDDRPAKIVQLLGAEKLLSVTRDAFLKTSHSKLIRETHLIRDGSPGLKIVALRPRSRQETLCAYLIGNRQYYLIVACPVGDAAAEADADKFLASFTLTLAAPPTGVK